MAGHAGRWCEIDLDVATTVQAYTVQVLVQVGKLGLFVAEVLRVERPRGDPLGVHFLTLGCLDQHLEVGVVHLYSKDVVLAKI